MILFTASSVLAWVYFKRFKKLQARVAQVDGVGAGNDSAGGEQSYDTRLQGRNAAQARRERRQRRWRERHGYREQQGISNLSDIPSRVDRGEQVELGPVKKIDAAAGPSREVRDGAVLV